MGYEAAFLGCPVVFINLISDINDGDGLNIESLSTFARQYHIQKYLVGNYPSCANNLLEVIDALEAAVSFPNQLTPYNNYVRSDTALSTMKEISNDILRQLV